MNMVVKAAVCAVCAVILAAQLKGTRREMAVLLSLSACVLIVLAGISAAGPILQYVEDLCSWTELDSALTGCLLRVCGITVLVQMTTVFCKEAGEGGIASALELLGGVAEVCCALPLMETVMDTIMDVLGG